MFIFTFQITKLVQISIYKVKSCYLMDDENGELCPVSSVYIYN